MAHNVALIARNKAVSCAACRLVRIADTKSRESDRILLFMRIYVGLLCLGLLPTCTPGSAPSTHTTYRLTLHPGYLHAAVHDYLQAARLPKDSAFVRVVFLETITHQYVYFSETSLLPNYQLAQPEGWFIQGGVLMVVMQAGEFYQRNSQVEKEVAYQLDSLKVKLTSNAGATVEPSARRLSYCVQTKAITWDDEVMKLADDECD
jgi:hypothetical protein